MTFTFNSKRCLAFASLMLFFSAAVQASSHPQTMPKPHTQATVFHVVFCWLKRSGNQADRQQLIAISKQLQAIPGIVSVTAGTMLPSARSIVDSSYDVGIIMGFESVAAMQHYLQHPLHLKAVKEGLQPLTSKVQIYDFQVE